MFGINPSVFWVCAVIVLAIIEAATLGLTVIWFAVGALGAAAAAYMGISAMGQIITFLIISTIMLIFTKPLIKDKLKVKNTPTNLDRTVGQKGVVIEKIDNIEGKGQIKVGGLTWTARNQTEEIIPVGADVEVIAIQGVKAIVRKV